MEILGNILMKSVVTMVISALIGLLQYVMTSYSLYSIARRRGISGAWLAWLPLGDRWILGCISDQYRYVTRGVRRSKRKFLVALTVVTSVVGALASRVLAYIVEELFSMTGADVSPLVLVGLLFLLVVVGIWNIILVCMATYDLYASAEPKNAALYLVLSILLGSILKTILIYSCRNKDDGMPPPVPEPLSVTVMLSD